MEQKFICYEVHRPNIPDNGCTKQCENCKSIERAAILAEVNPSTIKHKILDETPEETVQKARDYGDSLVNKDLEEAALKRYPPVMIKRKQEQEDYNISWRTAFIAGAKWQTERSFSLEEMDEKFFGTNGYFDEWLDYKIENNRKISFKDWFNKYKRS